MGAEVITAVVARLCWLVGWLLAITNQLTPAFNFPVVPLTLPLHNNGTCMVFILYNFKVPPTRSTGKQLPKTQSSYTSLVRVTVEPARNCVIHLVTLLKKREKYCMLINYYSMESVLVA